MSEQIDHQVLADAPTSASKPMTRQDYRRHAVGFIVLILAVLVALNLVFSFVTTARWDLTAEQQFTLSPATVEILHEIQAPIRVRVFISEDLPAPEHDLHIRMRDLLNEFEANAHGMLAFEIIHPKTAMDEQVANGFGMRKVAVSQKDSTQRSIRLVFKGFSIQYKDAAETIPEIRSTDNLEYLLAKTIVNLTRPASKTVGLLTGFGGLGEAEILQTSMGEVFNEVYGSRIALKPVHVDEKTCLLSDKTDALILLNLEKTLTPCAQYALEQASLGGTSLGVLQSPTLGDYMQPDQPRIAVDSGLNPVLAQTGVTLQNTLLLDRTHNLVGTQFTEDDQLPVSLPALPILRDFDRSHSITQNLTALVFPFSGTVSLDAATLSAHHARTSILAQSAVEAVTRQAGGDIQWDSLSVPRDAEVPGPHVVALALQTPLDQSIDLPGSRTNPAELKHNDDARYLIIANGEFLFTNKIIGYTDQFAKYGIHFFVNAIEWLVQDEALIDIRNRTVPPVMTPPDAETQKSIIRINVVYVPIAVCLIMLAIRGARRWRIERLRKKYERS